MRNFFFFVFFIILLILCILFFFQFYQSKTNVHVDESISLSQPKSAGSALKPKVANEAAKPPKMKDGVAKDGAAHHAYAYRSYSYSTEPTSESYSYEAEPTSAAVSDSEPMAPAPTEAPAVTTEPAPGSESALKYVLFSVTYDAQMIAGETKSLQLRMSPRDELAKLQKALNENKIQQSQIKEIEKVKNKYRYVSAHLVARNNCLKIEKMMPEEDKVYLPNVNESTSDQIWQWDMTAPEAPRVKVCQLSLFIRFCLNQNDCLPMTNPDKEFSINVEVTVGHRLHKWLTEIGVIAGVVISILTIIGFITGWIWKIWRRKKSSSR